MNFRMARLAMVESQIRPNGVRDPAILDAFADVPRELFVPERQKPLAYIDEALQVVPPAPGSPPRSLLAPMVLARLLQFANPAKTERALDIGGVTGYSAAILSELCASVDALETPDNLAAQMSQYLKAAGIGGVAVHSGALDKGWEAGAPYNLIILNGAVSLEPKELYGQLADGGRLMAILRRGWQGQAWLYSKNGRSVSARPVFDAGADFLPGFEPRPQFVF